MVKSMVEEMDIGSNLSFKVVNIYSNIDRHIFNEV